MRKPNRFVLAALLTVAFGAVIAVGYARRSYRHLVSEATLLEKEGVALAWNETWLNWVRPVSVSKAQFSITEQPNERARIGDVEYTVDDANARFVVIAERLKGLGIEEVQIIKNGQQVDAFALTE